MARKNPWLGVEGYFITPDGQYWEVMEHFTEVKGDPGAFGFTAEMAAKWDRVKDRERVLIAVLKNGFVRVRGHRTYTTFELWKLTRTLLGHMKRITDKVAFYPEEDVLIQEVSTHKHWEGTMREMKGLTADRFNEDKVAN